MRFVLKALFFLAVVAAFIPKGPSSTSTLEPQTAQRAAQSKERLCEQRPALCQAAQESATMARLFGGVAMDRARAAIEESEVFQEFAGSGQIADSATATP